MARVVVIDESETVVRAVRALLSRDGHSVEHLPRFGDLAVIMKRRRPDLIVVDLDADGVTDPGVLDGLRAACRSAVPVIIYSSCAEDEIADAIRAIGGAVHVPKGVPMMMLRAVIARTLGSSRLSA